MIPRERYLRLFERFEDESNKEFRQEMRDHVRENYLEGIDKLIPTIELSEHLIDDYQHCLIERVGVDITRETAIRMLKLHPETSLQIMNFDTIFGDTAIKEAICNDFCKFVVGVGTPSFGSQLSDQELKKYYEIVRTESKAQEH